MGKYTELYKKILTSNLDPKKKAILIKMLNVYLTYENKEELKQAEDEVYTVDGKTLSDYERVKLEYELLQKYYKDNASLPKSNNNKKIIKREGLHGFIYNNDLKKLLIEKEKINGTDNDKEMIAEEQIENNIQPKFITAYYKILKKYLEKIDSETIEEENNKSFKH